MQQRARYKLNFESRWLIASGVMMGIAFFVQVIYYIGVLKLAIQPHVLALNLLLPMVLEAVWCILMRGTKLNAAGVFGILGALVCLLLMVQSFFLGDTLRIVLSVLGYLLAGASLIFITGGFFPYKLIGMAIFALIWCVRFFCYAMPVYINPQNWVGLLQEVPGLCLIAALVFFFGGITGVRIQNEE